MFTVNVSILALLFSLKDALPAMAPAEMSPTAEVPVARRAATTELYTLNVKLFRL